MYWYTILCILVGPSHWGVWLALSDVVWPKFLTMWMFQKCALLVVVVLLSTTVSAVVSSRRNLFVGDGSYCTADGTTSVGQPGDFRFSTIVFAPKFQPTCDCTTTATNGGNHTQFHCENECETCFDDVCGVLETTEQYANAPDSVETQSNYSLCMTYSPSGEVSGTTCFEYQLDEDAAAKLMSGDDDDSYIPCQLKYNDVPCTWCKLFSSGCIQSNCTNFLPDARINTCRAHNQGLEEQFKMAALVNSLPKTREIQQGKCGVVFPAAVINASESGDPTSGMDDLQLEHPDDTSGSRQLHATLWILPILAPCLLSFAIL